MDGTGIRLQNIPLELANFLKVDSTFPFELIVDNRLIESQGRIVVILADAHRTGPVVVETHEIFLWG